VSTQPADAESRLRRVAALRTLCRRLPHLPTPAEEAWLRRYEELRSSPHEATLQDTQAVVAGWEALWRSGSPAGILEVARALPPELVAGNRRLQSLLVAAQTATGRARTG